MVWLQCAEPRPFAAQRVICFPHAGGSPYFFRGWAKALTGFEVHTVCYPGRAERITESPATDILSMARHIAVSVKELMADGRPTALFGHSMGAFIAYEVCAALEDEGHELSHFFASGARAPHLTRPDPDAESTWDDEAVAELLLELGGTDAELLENRAFLDLVMPYIKADFRMLASYDRSERGPLSTPVTAVVGEEDPRVSAEQAAAWGEATRGAFRMRTVPGGHFYLAEQPPFDVITESVGDSA
ncbi:alpha/beta fold hydrolase [Streptomyces sp. NPDC041068]|uniref:thioesterase II family protein n=1 Tax=Streptomyces sp. NPDC041068 TaxID=3155130 RepID=UPI0033F2B135